MTRSKAGTLGEVVRVIIAEPIPESRSDDTTSDEEEE